jgi:hypothetical protein
MSSLWISRRGPALAAVGLMSACLFAAADTVKITLLGSHDGELCRFDRVLILRDPDGTQLLYDTLRFRAYCSGHCVSGGGAEPFSEGAPEPAEG